MTTSATTNNAAGVATERSSRRRGGLSRPPGLPWVLPALVVSVGVLYYCIGYTGYLSTLKWDGASPLQLPVGLANYATMVKDPIFWRAIGNTAVFYVVTFSVQVVLGVVLASLLHSRLYLKTLYKVLIFIPVVLAPATTAPVFREIYAPTGTLNTLLQGVGLGGLSTAWFANGTFSLIIIMSVQIWQSTGVVFILYFAAIGQIEPEMVEAARIDGAGDLRILGSIVWPSVRGTTIAIAILSAIGSLKTFDIPFLITSGGPTYATEFLGTRIYRISVQYSNVGLGAAFSIVLLVLAVGTAVLIQAGARRREARSGV
ncbi:carbohydrate ABC transporter permease [Amnibacterium setariae]|uniref:Sugar ABC transporter permease n=1 Tax=Amnibacterium setariae TaxID=2306585 RepID=A0A3A1U2X9_9MICO|nr:sugar ABC transporter permease [Amnibacterium setariae]RIX30762.1 sugar ABC transporter permease [Amnibacterium setariae]